MVGGTEILAVPLGIARPPRLDLRRPRDVPPAGRRAARRIGPGGAPGRHGRRGHRPGRAVPDHRAVLLRRRRTRGGRRPGRRLQRLAGRLLRRRPAPALRRGHAAAAGPGGRRARELRRAVDELGFVAGFVRPNPCRGRSLSDRAYDAVWDAAEELDVPIGDPRGQLGHRAHARLGPPLQPAVLHAVSHSFEQMLACAQLIAFGVLERHPGLRVLFLESSGGWAPVLARAPRRAGRVLRRLLPRPARCGRRSTSPASAPSASRSTSARCPRWHPSSARRASCGAATTRTTTPPSPAPSTRCGPPSPPAPPRPRPRCSGSMRGGSTASRRAGPDRRGLIDDYFAAVTAHDVGLLRGSSRPTPPSTSTATCRTRARRHPRLLHRAHLRLRRLPPGARSVGGRRAPR